MKRSKINTRKRRNRSYDANALGSIKTYTQPAQQNSDFTVFKTLEKNISELPFEEGYEVLRKASDDYIANLNTPTEEPTKEMPAFLNHGEPKQNHFYVFEKALGDKIAFGQAVFVVSLCACLLLGALIVSWRLHLPDWCYR